MGRSRSPSPSRRVRKRSRERDRMVSRDRKRRSRRTRSRSADRRRRSRTPDRGASRHMRRSRSHSCSSSDEQNGLYKREDLMPREFKEEELVGKSPEEVEMMKIMGFCNFDTTKGRKVDNNDTGDVNVSMKRKYRQYMNRRGGFNKPLDRVA